METMPFSGVNEALSELERIGRIGNMSVEQRRQYDRDLKTYRDVKNQLVYAAKEGHREGHALGRAEGRAEVIGKMRGAGMSEEQIAAILGLPQQEISEMLSYKSSTN